QIIGVIGGAEGAATVLTDARRFLTPDGLMLPERCQTRIAAVTLPEPLASQPTLGEVAAYYTAQTFAQVGQPFDLRLCIKHFPLDHLRSSTDLLEDLDFRQPLPSAYERPLELAITSTGRLDGFLVWLNLHVGDGAVIDTLNEEYAWLPVYFPAFDPPLDVQAGDRIVGTVWGGPQAHPTQPDYGVTGEVIRATGERVPFAYTSAYASVQYRANSFYDRLFATEPSLTPPAATTTGDVVGTLRRYAQEHLPEYMVPSAFVVLDALPLTPHGKLDRHALPAPELAKPETGSAFVAPRTPDEELLAGIWASVLHVQRVGIHDNFFDLGGHSLLATQVITRIRKTFGAELPLRALFETPTVAGLVPTIVKARGAAPSHERPPLARVPRDRPLPLSFAQQRLWFLDQLEPGSPAYNVPVAVKILGALDPEALEHSLNALVTRHEILRTTFTSQGGQPIQVILPQQSLVLDRHDLHDLPAAEREAEALRLMHQSARQPFNLASDSLVRVLMVRLSDREHLLALTMHHIVADEWSLGVIIREIAAFYQGYVRGQTITLPELPIQYADYSVWQRQWLQGAVLEEQLGYWKQHLAGAPGVLQLPTDYPRPAVQTFRGARHTIALPSELSTALQQLSRQEGVTLFMTLLAAFKVLLSRYSGQTDLVVGVPIAGRQQVEAEALIGLFFNTTVLRTDLGGRPTFRDLLARVRSVALSAYAHQDVPFEQLVDHLHINRDLGQNPLFQVLFDLHNTPTTTTTDVADLQFQSLPISTDTVKVDLALGVDETVQGLVCTFHYSTDLFAAATIERLATHYATLLQAVVATPAQPIALLPLLTAGERHELVVTRNATAAPYPSDRCAHQLVQDQVARTPEAVAAIFGEQQLTYAQLDARANQLAHSLQSLGVGPEVRVGVCLDRSLDLVIAILAIWKAGGAFVPLDPAFPPERSAFILADAQVVALLTHEHLLPRFADAGLPCLALDRDWSAIAQQPATPVLSSVTAANLAYLIYTSGSTGRPKGVLIPHTGLVNYLHWAITAYTADAGIGAPVQSSIAADAIFPSLFLPLLVGAAVVLLPESHALE
ncbi:MAG TPA: condensation domain-containing protein, partial [Herpetosiphonaceae bacterium]